MQKTVNYQLNQWDAGDAVKRTDFNEDNAKIDAALKAAADALSTEVNARAAAVTAAGQEAANALAAYKASNNAAVATLQAAMPKIAIGTYSGTGNGSSTLPNQTQEIYLGFQPKAVFISQYGDIATSSQSAFFTQEHSLAYLDQPMAKVTETGFLVGLVYYTTHVLPVLNLSGSQYFYLAIG